MPLPVSLSEVTDELRLVNDASTAYVNRVTGETLVAWDDLLPSAGEDDPSLPEWQREEAARIREARASDDWLALPSRFDIHPHAIMEAFCWSVPAGEGGDALARAIRGRGAFRRFRDAVERLGLLERWYAHEEQAYRRIAARWLDDHGIPYVDTET